MRRFLARLGADALGTQFKRTSQGWIFATPGLWPLTSRNHYITDETQKNHIELIVGLGHTILFSAASLAVLWFVLGAIAYGPSDWNRRFFIFVLCCFLLSIIQHIGQYIVLNLVAKNLPQS